MCLCSLPTCVELPVKAFSWITSMPSGITKCGFFLSFARPFALSPGTITFSVPAGFPSWSVTVISFLYPICLPSGVILKSSRVQVKDSSFAAVESVEAALDSADACTLLSSRLFVWRLVLLTSIRVWVSLVASKFSVAFTSSVGLMPLVVSLRLLVSTGFAVSLELEELIFSWDFAEVLSKAPPHWLF